MEYFKNDFEAIKQVLDSLTLQERNYVRYLRMKERVKEHWMNQRYKKVG